MKTTGIALLLTFAFLLSCHQLFSIDAAYTLKQNQELVSRHHAPDTLSITTAITALQEALEIQPESQEFNYTLLGLALLMKDGALAYTAWNNYFHLLDYDTNKEKRLGSVKMEIKTILSGWNRNELTRNQRNCLILALAHSRMYELGAMVSNLLPVEKESNEVQEIIDYAKYIKQFETNVYSYFSETKSGKANKAHFVKKMEALNLQLWNSIKSSKESAYSEKQFKKLLSEKFGTIRVFNLKHSIFYLSHVLFENKIIGTQDNETITCKFKMVDFVFGNALLGWYKNIFLFGGFAGAGKQIVQFKVQMNENLRINL